MLDAVPHYCPISSNYKWNLDGLMDMVFEYLAMTRIYTKPRGQMPDYSAPVILRGVAEPTVELLCKKIHRTLLNDFKYAWVWGASVKHNPGRMGKGHVLQVRRLRSRGGLLRSRGGLLRICSRRTRAGCVCVCVCRQRLSGFFPYPSNLFDVEKHHI